jgi:hypothetical protein
MFFKKRNSKKVFLESPIIENIENRITSLLNVSLYKESNDKIKSLIKDEIEQSRIGIDALQNYYINREHELVDFSTKLFSSEKVIDETEYEGISHGLGKWFSITHSIYFHFLSNNQIFELSEFLKLRQIPKSDLFLDRLKKYFEFSQKNLTSLEFKFNNWIEQLNESENPESQIIAFNFGLFEKPNGFSMYLIGSKEFSKDDDDWSCNEDFEPKNKYMEFPTETIKEKNWEDILNCSVELIKKYVESNKFQNSILKNAVAITTGFDDGNLNRIL